jgi:hypothetical protein
MPEIGWIDALRRWNMGGTSWCVPKKGTVGYNTVMKIRRGEPATVAEHVKEIERKKVKTSMAISLDSPKEEKVETVDVPTINLTRRTVKAKVPASPKPKKPKNDVFVAELKRIVALMKEHPEDVGVGYVGRFAAEGKRFRMSPKIIQDKGRFIVFDDKDMYRLLIDLDYKDNEISFQFAGGVEGIHPDLETPTTPAEIIKHLETSIAHQERDNPDITGFHLKE